MNDRGGVHAVTVLTADRLQGVYTIGTKPYLAAAANIWELQPK